VKRSRLRSSSTPLPRHARLKRYTPLKSKRSSAVTREFEDKTTGEKRLILSDADWRKMKRGLWTSRAGKKLLCGICGFEIRRYKDLEPDHIEPRGMDGARRTDFPENIQASHSWCNREKGSKRDFKLLPSQP
jgi:5-methylcytosine-specific restriction endonuclease McrA